MKYNDKVTHLKEILTQLDSALLAYSGGVDSTLLLKLAHDYIPGKVLAVTATSEIYLPDETNFAQNYAASLEVEQVLIPNSALQNPLFIANPPERCYHCKSILFQRLKELSLEYGIAAILDGSNLDDAGDFRPGTRAAQEHGVISPLKLAGFTKADIRQLAKELGLPVWNQPSMACLASRFPYGEPITAAKLSQVYQGEQLLRQAQVTNVRVRHHGELARIEVDPQAFPLLINEDFRARLLTHFQNLGFKYITLDLTGFRSGSMNEVLAEEKKQSWI